ncbi:SulP family inorganic anion transporter [Alsobacter sp. R-9]
MGSWTRWLPGLVVLRHYRLSWLHHDVFAGLVLSTMLVPVGIAYAVASGLPGIYGLYATIVPLLVYALVGPSRIMVLGPDSALAPIILGTVLALAPGDPARAVAVAGAVAVVAGSICVVAGLARLGFVTELLSKPIRYGYMNGIALTVILDQLPKLLGLAVRAEHPVGTLRALASAMAGGELRPAAAGLGIGLLLLILVLRRVPRIPAFLVAFVVAIGIVEALDLAGPTGVAVLGTLPQGLPSWSVPAVSPADLGPVLLGGAAVALVAFADMSVLSRVYALKTGHRVDPNQELVALGLSNVATGFFQGFPVSSSSSRTPVAEASGARTQVVGVVGAVAVAVLLVTAPRLIESLPVAALAAVVIVSAAGLVTVGDLARIARVQPWEFWLSVACSAGVLLLGVIPGIGLAIVGAVIEFLWDGWRPHSAVLGKAEGVAGFHDLRRYPQARQVPGLVLFRWDAPLFFANAEFFRERVLAAVAAAPSRVRRVVVAAEPVTSIDVTAADALVDLVHELAEKGIDLDFAELKDPVKDKFLRLGVLRTLAPDAFHPTVEAAVEDYLADHREE